MSDHIQNAHEGLPVTEFAIFTEKAGLYGMCRYVFSEPVHVMNGERVLIVFPDVHIVDDDGNELRKYRNIVTEEKIDEAHG